jgi:predicted secreted protein
LKKDTVEKLKAKIEKLNSEIAKKGWNFIAMQQHIVGYNTALKVSISFNILTYY